MRNPPDHAQFPSPDDDTPQQKPGGRRAHTIRDMFAREKTPRRRRTGEPPASERNGPPDSYDLGPAAAPGPPTQPRRAAYSPAPEQMRSADQTDPRYHNRPDSQYGPRDGDYYAAREQQRPPAPPAPYSDPDRGSPRSGAEASMRWKQPDWLGQAPQVPPPPTDFAPPTTPRYSRPDAEAPIYQAVEPDPQQQQTDYRATSARAALWASRTPSYQPDQPATLTERYTDEERSYFEAYDTRRAPASIAHAQASMSSAQSQLYAPGVVSDVERLRQQEKTRGRSAGPAPYFWEMGKKARQISPVEQGMFWLVSLLVVLAALLTSAYAGISVYAASQIVYAPQVMPQGTPAGAGLAYKDVLFTSRIDHVTLRGWFIPGVAASGSLSDSETIIVAHDLGANRADPGVGLLSLSEALARHGFAVLAFDMRGSGDSASAPTSLGYLEQRDILGAVDFLRSGALPYPDLGRPKAIGGWGVSMGAVALLLAAAQEPALRAVVSDSAYTDVTPILQRELAAHTSVPATFIPGVMRASQVMYGIDYSAINPGAVVARIAPRPILFIHGADDSVTPPGAMTALAQAAQQAPGAHTQTWLAPDAQHAQAYHVEGQAYINRIVTFFSASLASAA